ncbi:MAG: AtpZ/AtpI family protein [Gammaproteobacteria bacterium]|nr:AtpZ/AtpI family protein [Gammaproteobacteria bacterium]
MDEPQNGQKKMLDAVTQKTHRKIAARAHPGQSSWFGLGMMGLVGWSVAIPMLAGVAFGLWIDSQWPSRFSWTLMFLFAGGGLGCYNAWRWINREGRKSEH